MDISGQNLFIFFGETMKRQQTTVEQCMLKENKMQIQIVYAPKINVSKPHFLKSDLGIF